MKLQRWNQLHSQKLAQLPPHQQYFKFAAAYLDSAQRLCTTLSRSTRKATFERGAVVLYLTQHALELFYKGGILRRAPTERFSHGLEQLHTRYHALYPGIRFHIPRLFSTSYDGLTRQEIAQVQGLEPPIDQLCRYPEDKKGNPWNGLFAFEASSFRAKLATLQEKMSRARSHIDG